MFAADVNGKVKDGVRDVINLALKPQTLRDRAPGRASGSSAGSRCRPGKYQLRVGARESGAASVGTVILDLEAPDFSKGPLAMSGIAIASAYGQPDADGEPRSFRQRVQGRAAVAADRVARVPAQRHARRSSPRSTTTRSRRRIASRSPRTSWPTTGRWCMTTGGPAEERGASGRLGRLRLHDEDCR